MKDLTTHPYLNNMLNQIRDNARNESEFKVRMEPNGDLRINGNQIVTNERHFNELREDVEDYGDLPHSSDCFWED